MTRTSDPALPRPSNWFFFSWDSFFPFFFFSFPPQCSGCIPARENSTDAVLGTTSGRSHDSASSQHPWPPPAWHDASPTHGRAPDDANDGPTSPGNDASRTCSWHEAAHGRTYANDARAPNDETPLQTHDGANQAGNDPSRQIKVEMKLPFHIRTFPMRNATDLCPCSFVLGVWRDSAVTSVCGWTHPALTCTRPGFLGVSSVVLLCFFPPLNDTNNNKALLLFPYGLRALFWTVSWGRK